MTKYSHIADMQSFPTENIFLWYIDMYWITGMNTISVTLNY